MSASESAVAILQTALSDGKGADIRTLQVGRQSGGLFSWMIIATANSPRHAAALAERARLALKEAGLPCGHREGGRENVRDGYGEEAMWILVDAGDVVVHIMQDEARTLYDLESLWGFEGD